MKTESITRSAYLIVLGFCAGLCASLLAFWLYASPSDLAIAGDEIVDAATGVLWDHSETYRNLKLKNAFNSGRTAAKLDIDAGVLGYKFYGGPPHPLESTYWALLTHEYGLELESVGSCTVQPLKRSYADGYNEVMVERITEVFGDNVLDSAWRQVLESSEQEATDDS